MISGLTVRTKPILPAVIFQLLMFNFNSHCSSEGLFSFNVILFKPMRSQMNFLIKRNVLLHPKQNIGNACRYYYGTFLDTNRRLLYNRH